MTNRINRREFLAEMAVGGAALVLGGCAKGTTTAAAAGGKPRSKAPVGKSVLAVASKGSPEANTRAAVAALGGMAAFVKKGDKVAIKPNIGWARTPAQAANTHPEVVVAIIKMCFDAGASEVKVIEHTCDTPAQLCFDMSGIKAAMASTNAKLVSGDNAGVYRDIAIPKGKVLTKCKVMTDALDADVLISVPIAKTHGASVVTLGMKNFMGIIWDRGAWHQADLHQCIADFMTAVIPTLTILDANRILLTNGPKGPGETRDEKTVAASADLVAIDAFGAGLFGKKGTEIPFIVKAHEHGLGEIDLSKVTVKKV